MRVASKWTREQVQTIFTTFLGCHEEFLISVPRSGAITSSLERLLRLRCPHLIAPLLPTSTGHQSSDFDLRSFQPQQETFTALL